MPVEKFHSVEKMSQSGKLPPPASDRELLRRMEIVWRRAGRLAPATSHPRGVLKFRSVEEARRARYEARDAAATAAGTPPR